MSTENDCQSSSESDWEEVADAAIEDSDDAAEKEVKIPEEGVEITLDLPGARKRSKAKKEFDLAAYVRRKVNRFKKEVRENVHKVHLLCLLGHGIWVNRLANEKLFFGVALSIIPENLFASKNRKAAELLMEWFRSKFCTDSPSCGEAFHEDVLLKAFEQGGTGAKTISVVMFLVCARAMGIDARLVISFQPVPLKEGSEEKPAVKKRKPENIEKTAENLEKKQKTDKKPEQLESECDEKVPKNVLKKQKKDESKEPQNGKHSGNSHPDEEKIRKKKKAEHKPEQLESECDEKVPKKVSKKQKTDALKEAQNVKHSGNSRPDEEEMSGNTTKRRSRRIAQKAISYNEGNGSDTADAEENDGTNNCDNSRSRTRTNQKANAKIPKSNIVEMMVEDSDDDFKPEKKRHRSFGKGFKNNRKALSSDDDDSIKGNACNKPSTNVGTDYWIEIYDTSSKSWVSVDCTRGIIDQVKDLESNASKPISYVLAFDSKGYVKDVTRRYASNWLSSTRKLRVDAEWWDETLQPFRGPRTKKDKLEDEKLEEKLLERPLPTTISELKSHPLYALKRHLLKFEGIYPPESVPVGYIRNEPIYSRECVKELHSRETWLKEARLVRLNETAYKVVKARPKYIRLTGEFQTDIPLELFGEWQTEPYVPPTARDGKVPRNDYGNVELFKPTMLPKGTVHIQIPGLNRVAKKLGIDCAAAMTGWDFHAGGSHPTFDGWIVCKEFKATLLEAWDEEQINIERREKEKREKRVYGNWRRLIRGLLIKEKVRLKYSVDLSLPTDEPHSSAPKTEAGAKRKQRKAKT